MPKRLKHHGRLVFFWYLQTRDISIVYSAILVNPRYLDSFFDDQKIVVMSDAYEEFELHTRIEIESHYAVKVYALFGLRASSILALLRLANFTSIGFRCVGADLDERFVKQWLEICAILKEKKALQWIDLCAQQNVYQMVMDLMPAKVKKLQVTYTTGYVFLPQRFGPIDSFHYGICRSRPYLNGVLRSKAKDVWLDTRGDWIGLYEMPEFGPFQPNPFIESLQFPVYFYRLQHDGEYNVPFTEYLRRYRIGLEYLQAMNPRIRLDIQAMSPQSVYVETLQEAIDGHQQRMENIHAFIDVACELELTIKLGSMYTEIYVKAHQLNNTFIRNFAQTLEMADNPAQSPLAKVLENSYRGVDIRIVYDFVSSAEGFMNFNR